MNISTIIPVCTKKIGYTLQNILLFDLIYNMNMDIKMHTYKS